MIGRMADDDDKLGDNLFASGIVSQLPQVSQLVSQSVSLLIRSIDRKEGDVPSVILKRSLR